MKQTKIIEISLLKKRRGSHFQTNKKMVCVISHCALPRRGKENAPDEQSFPRESALDTAWDAAEMSAVHMDKLYSIHS